MADRETKVNLQCLSREKKILLAANHLLLAGRGPEPPESPDSWSKTRDWVVVELFKMVNEL